MKNERITVQDIANSIGLSRNTVSKALNGQYVPPKTREAVLQAAIDLGYKSYRTVSTSEQPEEPHRRIALITSRILMTMNYFVYIVRGIESALADDPNVELLQFTTTKSSFFDKLVSYLRENEVDGIICIELYQPDYIPRLISLGYPIVFLDFPVMATSVTGNFDVVMPESLQSIRNFCLSLIRERGVKSFGFVGDYRHCSSFYHRFLGMRDAIFASGLDFDPRQCIVEKDSFPYDPEHLAAKITEMPTLPDVFIAANDALAIGLIEALKLCRKKVARNVLVTGFDNNPESKTCDPPLTTFNVDKSGLGKKLLSVLLERIKSPHQKNEYIFLQTKPIIRQTT